MNRILSLLVVFCWMVSFGLAHASSDLSDAIANRTEAEKALKVMEALDKDCSSLSSPEDIRQIAIEGFEDPNLEVVIPSYLAVQEACSLGLIKFLYEDLQKALGLSTKEFTLEEITNGINNWIMLLRKYPEISSNPNAEISRLLLFLNYRRQLESISPQSSDGTQDSGPRPPDRYGTGWVKESETPYGGMMGWGCVIIKYFKCDRECPDLCPHCQALVPRPKQRHTLEGRTLYGFMKAWSGGVNYDPSNKVCCSNMEEAGLPSTCPLR